MKLHSVLIGSFMILASFNSIASSLDNQPHPPLLTTIKEIPDSKPIMLTVNAFEIKLSNKQDGVSSLSGILSDLDKLGYKLQEPFTPPLGGGPFILKGNKAALNDVILSLVLSRHGKSKELVNYTLGTLQGSYAPLSMTLPVSDNETLTLQSHVNAHIVGEGKLNVRYRMQLQQPPFKSDNTSRFNLSADSVIMETYSIGDRLFLTTTNVQELPSKTQ